MPKYNPPPNWPPAPPPVYGLGESEDLIVNDIGNFSGKYLVPSGTVLLRIAAVWRMPRVNALAEAAAQGGEE